MPKVTGPSWSAAAKSAERVREAPNALSGGHVAEFPGIAGILNAFQVGPDQAPEDLMFGSAALAPLQMSPTSTA